MTKHTHTWKLYRITSDEKQRKVLHYICTKCGGKGEKK